MSDRPHYIAGRPWATCDRCAEVVRHDCLKREWTNLLVCPPCWDPRPAQLSPPKVGPEGLPIKDPRPEPPEIFVTYNDVQPEDL